MMYSDVHIIVIINVVYIIYNQLHVYIPNTLKKEVIIINKINSQLCTFGSGYVTHLGLVLTR